jgi:hypothetical protein
VEGRGKVQRREQIKDLLLYYKKHEIHTEMKFSCPCSAGRNKPKMSQWPVTPVLNFGSYPGTELYLLAWVFMERERGNKV